MKLIRVAFLVIAATICWQPAILSAQTVTMGSIPGTHFCSGDPISVSFTATGTFGHKNAFTLQLSDPTGSFSSGFNNIGSIKDTIAGTFTIVGQIPEVQAGTKYRLRILAAVPFLPSRDNGVDLSIGVLPPHPRFERRSTDNSTDPYVAVSIRFDSSDYPEGIFYSTGGIKQVILKITDLGGCSSLDTQQFYVLDCRTPVIPSWAVVIDTDQIYRGPGTSLWVNPGVSLTLRHGGDTIYAEIGSKISTSSNLIYQKRGSQAQVSDGLCIHDSGASFSGDNLLCPGLRFDYTQAPPNIAFHNGVFTNPVMDAIKLSPNPARGPVTISGLPKGIVSMKIVNVLGATVKDLPRSGASSVSVELSSLPAGPYFLRIEAGNSIFTKRLIKE